MKTVLCEDPLIYTIDGFITDKECDHMIDISKSKLQQALVAGNNKGYVSQGRTGQNCWIGHNTDEVTLKIAHKICNIVEYPIENAESFQVIHYNQSQEYRNHYDAWKFDNSEKSNRCLLKGGQRMITALVYLNDVKQGGGTKFNRLNIDVQPKKGKILVFQNHKPNSNIVHPMSEHAGTPVVEGEKYAFNLWFRQQNRNKNFIL